MEEGVWGRQGATNVVSVLPVLSEIAFIPQAGLVPMSEQTTTQRSKPEGHTKEQGKHAAEQRSARHTRRTTTIGIIAVSVVMVVGLVSLVMSYGQPSPPSVYPAIDYVPCQGTEQGGAHFHAHVSLYINGKRMLVPANVGIAPDGSCLYWLHTHDASGVIHIEAPMGVSVTFGNFLDIWAQQFRQLDYPGQLSDPVGWRVYVNGKLFTSDFHTIPLHSHTLMTLAYNSPGVKPDTNYNWDDL